MNRNKLAYILEIIWLVVTVLCLAMAIHSTVIHGIKQSYIKFAFALLGFLMYLIRRNKRLKPQ